VFSWNIPTGHNILYSNALDPNQQTVQYISPDLLFSMQGDGSIQSQEFDSKFSVEISSGSLTITNFSTSTSSTSDAITTQAGSYTCRSVRGIYSYDVIDINVSTTTTTTTTTTIVANAVPSSNDVGMESLTEVSIYYIVLGVFLLLVLAFIIFMLARIHRRKKPLPEDEQLISPEIPQLR